LKPGCDQLFRAARNDSQACKEEYDALVKALNEFLSLVQNGSRLSTPTLMTPVTLITRSK